MVTIIERPTKLNEQYEFREACSPDEHPGWTVHAIIERQRVDTVSVSKSYMPTGSTYPTSITEQEPRVINYTVYLMRRRIDKALEELAAKAECFEGKWNAAVKAEIDLKAAFQTERSKLNDQIATLTQDRDNLNELHKGFQERLNGMNRMEADLAKLRDHLGKERYDAIIAVAQLEKMAGDKK